MSEPTLASLMSLIGDKYTFTNEHYPHVDLSTPEKVRVFAIAHSLLHMNKSLGRIATEREALDHGGTMDDEKLRITTAKMLVNTLKLAEELGMSSEDLETTVSRVLVT